MAANEREEVYPPPPPYQHNNVAAYQPPSGPPPQESSAYQPPHGSPPPLNLQEPAAISSESTSNPPSLSEAPPLYEPFNFSTAFARSHQSNAPKWHSPPAYNIYHDSINSRITFHIALPSTYPPCACSNDFICTCDRRRPAVWQATSSKVSRKDVIELQRLSPFSGVQQIAFTAIRDSGLRGNSSSLTIRDERQNSCARIKKTESNAWSYKDLQGQTVIWKRHNSRLELTNEQGLPIAILRTGNPSRLELTSFAWGRMPSDQIECDFPDCTLQPLFGFVFRCRDCTEQGDDSFDICEAHLFTECKKHNQSHRFVRQPRPFAEFDDCVQETPLLQAKDMYEERKCHELVIMSLASALLDVR